MKYNRTLDHVCLALAAAANGDMQRAIKEFAAAANGADRDRAVMILEASNANAEGAPSIVKASKAKPAPKKPATAAVKPAAKVTTVAAGKRLQAFKIEAFDNDGDEDDMDDEDEVLGNEEDAHDDEGYDEGEEHEDEGMSEEQFNASLKATLQRMTASGARVNKPRGTGKK